MPRTRRDVVSAIKTRNVDELCRLLAGETELCINSDELGEARDIGDAGARIIAQAWERGLALTKIVLWNTGVSDGGATALADILRGDRKLKHICFSYDMIGDVGARALAEALKTNSVLEVLDLGANERITNSGAQAIAEMLPYNFGLKFIHLGCSRITRDVVQIFITALGRNSHLTALQLANGDALKVEPLPSLLRRNEINTKSVISPDRGVSGSSWAFSVVTKGDHAILAIEHFIGAILTLEWFDFMPTRIVGVTYNSAAQTYAGVYGDDYISLLAALRNEPVPGVVRYCPKRGGGQRRIDLSGKTRDILFAELGWNPDRCDSRSVNWQQGEKLTEVLRRNMAHPPTFQITGRPNPNCIMWIKGVIIEATGIDLGYGCGFFDEKFAVSPTRNVGQDRSNRGWCCML